VFQATTSNVLPGGIDTFHASEKVLAFAEGVDASGLPSGQLVVNRSTVPSDGFDTSVLLISKILFASEEFMRREN